MTLLQIILWFTAFSLAAFALMGLDKRAAQTGGWRIPEHTLLLCALIGGGIGAKLAQRRFRHKTRKQPFATLLNLALAANAALAVLLLIPNARQAIITTLVDAL